MTVFNVSDAAGLYEALANATGGDKIKLAGGDYGELVLDRKSGFDITFDAPVNIISADLDSPASFSGMDLDGVKNLTFDDVAFNSTHTGDALWGAPFRVTESEGITIRGSVFQGKLAVSESEANNGYATGTGLDIGNSTNIVLEGNEFSTWHRGLVMGNTSDVVIKGNEFHSIRSDGMDFAQVQSVLIEDNYIHDFKTSSLSEDHADMIQFWTTGTDEPTTDITIRNNILDVGEGGITQSLFIRNEVVDLGLAGEEMFYQNILIEENVILNGSSHGITVGETDGLTIKNNSVLSSVSEKSQYSLVTIASASQDVTVEKNVVTSISGHEGQPDWVMTGNAFIQDTDPDAPGYYADLVFESSIEGHDSIWSHIVVPGTMIDNLLAGSSQLQLNTTPSKVTPQFDVMSSADASQALVFDATYTYGPTGQITSDDASFVWDFGDGEIATGKVVEHTYATAGNYDVKLTVLLDGQETSATAKAYAEVSIVGSDVIAFNATDGSFYLQGYGADVAIDDSDAASVATSEGMAVALGGTVAKVAIPMEAIAQFFGTDTFEMSMTLQADQAGTGWGEVVRVHPSMIVSVQPDGNLNIRLSTDAENINLTTHGVAVNDGLVHDISIQLNGASDSLQVLMDGAVVASETVVGSMPGMDFHGLVFGEPWGGQNFDAKLSAFELDACSTDYPIFEGVLEGPAEESVEPIRCFPGSDPEDSHDEGALPALDGFTVDFEQLRETQLRDDAYVETTADGSAAFLDGEEDFIRLGKLSQFEAAEQLSFSISYSKDTQNSDEQRLVWNNKSIGLTVEGDSLKVLLGRVDERFHKAIRIDDLGLDDTDLHQVMVLVDSATDHLQVVLDGVLVLDQQQDSDISFVDGFERGWKVGGGRKDFLDGEISDFQIDSSADFLSESLLVADDASLMG